MTGVSKRDGRAAACETPSDSELDDLLGDAVNGDAPAPEGSKPELLAAIDSVIDPYTRPPTIVARLRVRGRPDRIYRLQRPRTASEGTLLVLAHLLSELTEPTRVSAGLDDLTVARLLEGEIKTPPWLRRVWDIVDYELAAGDVSVTVEHVLLADDIAPYPVGHG